MTPWALNETSHPVYLVFVHTIVLVGGEGEEDSSVGGVRGVGGSSSITPSTPNIIEPYTRTSVARTSTERLYEMVKHRMLSHSNVLCASHRRMKDIT